MEDLKNCFDILYHSSCMDSPVLQSSCVVYGCLDLNLFIFLYFENDNLIMFRRTDNFEVLSTMIERYYGSFDRGVDDQFVFIDKLPNE